MFLGDPVTVSEAVSAHNVILPVQVRGPPQLVSSWCLLSALLPILNSAPWGTAANGGKGSGREEGEKEGRVQGLDLKSYGEKKKCQQL